MQRYEEALPHAAYRGQANLEQPSLVIRSLRNTSSYNEDKSVQGATGQNDAPGPGISGIGESTAN